VWAASVVKGVFTLNEQDLRRFWQKVDRKSDDECWLWTAKATVRGYGQFKVGPCAVLVHRLSYEIANGPFSMVLIVLHECDTPLCVNPKHLRLGTVADNNADMVAKGRSRSGAAPGEANWNAKLSADVVVAMRRSGLPSHVVAKQFGVNASTVRKVRRGERWKHIA